MDKTRRKVYHQALDEGFKSTDQPAPPKMGFYGDTAVTTCKACGSVASTSDNYCRACGRSVRPTCRTCGQLLPPDATLGR